MPKSTYLIVIGTSAGGLEALTNLVSGLPEDFPAPVLIVQHLSPATTKNILAQVLARNSKLTCKVAENGEDLKSGTVYLAPPDLHMLVEDGKVILNKGPHGNRWRPSIDMLFRSAAANFNSRAIGVVLTGLLDDGTAGMMSIKRAGGLAIVQQPEDARFQDMPLSVIQNMDVDYIVPLSEMAALLQELTAKPLPRKVQIPADLAKEAELSAKVIPRMEQTAELGPGTYFTCPDCGGVLTETDSPHLQHYRCHTGHSFSAGTLIFSQKEEYEKTIWVAIRMMEERRNLLRVTAAKDRSRGKEASAQIMEQRARDAERHAEKLRDLLLRYPPEENSAQMAS